MPFTWFRKRARDATGPIDHGSYTLGAETPRWDGFQRGKEPKPVPSSSGKLGSGLRQIGGINNHRVYQGKRILDRKGERKIINRFVSFLR